MVATKTEIKDEAANRIKTLIEESGALVRTDVI